MVPLIAFESETAATASVDLTSLDFGAPEEDTGIFESVRKLKQYAKEKVFGATKKNAKKERLLSEIDDLQQSINDHRAKLKVAEEQLDAKKRELASLQ